MPALSSASRLTPGADSCAGESITRILHGDEEKDYWSIRRVYKAPKNGRQCVDGFLVDDLSRLSNTDYFKTGSLPGE